MILLFNRRGYLTTWECDSMVTLTMEIDLDKIFIYFIQLLLFLGKFYIHKTDGWTPNPTLITSAKNSQYSTTIKGIENKKAIKTMLLKNVMLICVSSSIFCVSCCTPVALICYIYLYICIYYIYLYIFVFLSIKKQKQNTTKETSLLSSKVPILTDLQTFVELGQIISVPS